MHRALAGRSCERWSSANVVAMQLRAGDNTDVESKNHRPSSQPHMDSHLCCTTEQDDELCDCQFVHLCFINAFLSRYHLCHIFPFTFG